jgi:hypothetical protein
VYVNITLTTIWTLLTLYHLCRLLLVRLGGYLPNLSDFYSHRLIGNLTDFFSVSGVHLPQTDNGIFHYLRMTFSDQFKSKVGLTLTKAADLRITLNVDGTPIISKSHTHPSHSQTSRLLTSSLSFRYSSSSRNPVYVRHEDSSFLGFSLSSHRQS